MHLFGHASGLVVNMAKSAVLPIRCSQDEMELVSTALGCPVMSFPCKYLGLPLTLRKQNAAQLQALVDRVGECLPLWKAALLPKSGRLLLIQSVLCAIPVHSMLALDLPAKTLAALAKICRGFLWCGKEARGGNCSVAWDVVCRPKWAGGLGLPNIQWLNRALQARWPWLQKADKSRPWAEFQILVPAEALELVRAAAGTTIGNGRSTLFWEDRWMNGSRIQELAPTVYGTIPNRIRRAKLVSDALQNDNWVGDIGPDLSLQALQEFLRLWPQVTDFQLTEGAEDVVRWTWEKDGNFSARSAYAARFMGLEVSPTAAFTWKSRAPLQCRFFAWLALRNRCWTSDRLARRGLPHQDACPLCDQHEESIQHLLLGCVFAKQVWLWMGRITDRHEFAPQNGESLGKWCSRQDRTTVDRKVTRAKCLLGMWMLWKHRNDVVFNGATPSLAATMHKIREEGRLWAKAGLMKGNTKGFEADDGGPEREG